MNSTLDQTLRHVVAAISDFGAQLQCSRLHADAVVVYNDALLASTETIEIIRSEDINNAAGTNKGRWRALECKWIEKLNYHRQCHHHRIQESSDDGSDRTSNTHVTGNVHHDVHPMFINAEEEEPSIEFVSAVVLHNLGLGMLDQGMLAKSEYLFRLALDTSIGLAVDRQCPQLPLLVASANYHLAYLWAIITTGEQEQVQRSDIIAHHLRDALNCRDGSGYENHIIFALTLHAVGVIMANGGHHTDAMIAFGEASAIYDRHHQAFVERLAAASAPTSELLFRGDATSAPGAPAA